MTLKVSVGIGLRDERWEETVEWAVEVERLGVDSIWSSETWGFDAATPIAFIAARTQTIGLGTSIMQVGARTPAAVAMTALSLSSMSGGRFMLGLGTSGPVVIEGWHGVPFARPYTRLRETVEIVRLATSGERLAYEGLAHRLPLKQGMRPLRAAAAPRPIEIHLATLGPRSLEMTGELADGWIASSFIAEHASVFLKHLRIGAERAGRSLDDIERRAGGVVEFGDLEQLLPVRKPGFAFEMGAMGSPEHNFYRNAYARQGYAELTERVLALWLERRRDEAAAPHSRRARDRFELPWRRGAGARSHTCLPRQRHHHPQRRAGGRHPARPPRDHGSLHGSGRSGQQRTGPGHGSRGLSFVPGDSFNQTVATILAGTLAPANLS